MKLNNSKLVRRGGFTCSARGIIQNSALFLVLTLILFPSCETTEPPPSNQKLTLTAEDANCTEAWLNLKTENISLPTEIVLNQNDTTIIAININSNDTTLYVDKLLPSQTYNFQTIIQSTNRKSNIVSVTTMDTTSHNFTWETFTFGGANGSSYLTDVAIINENDIWAVGEIHTKDTDKWNEDSTKWLTPYNAVHWDGNTWELKRILYKNNFWTINTILAFSENDIWFDVFVHWNGSAYSNETIPNVLIGWRSNALWGTSSKDYYVVGTGGNIAHYNGSSWRKIESGTELPFQDIYGDGGEIIALASSHNYLGRKLYKIKNNTVTTVSDSGLYYVFGGLWFIKNKKYYIVGDGVFEKTTLDELSWNRYPIGFVASYYSNAINGVKMNDITIVGSYGDISHFNGKTWYEYKQLFNSQDELRGVDTKGEIIVAVGDRYTGGINDFGIICLGRR